MTKTDVINYIVEKMEECREEINKAFANEELFEARGIIGKSEAYADVLEKLLKMEEGK